MSSYINNRPILFMMPTTIALLIGASLVVSIFLMTGLTNGAQKEKPCEWNGIPLWGKVKVVSHNANIKVKVVGSFENIRVKVVENFADDCGEWMFVENHEDFTIEFVDNHEDLKIRFVKSFPGI
uniref:hypothetical protein n=1 Tax=Ignavibacterium sp. TaxID=2651167 RepID=UPI00307FCE59